MKKILKLLQIILFSGLLLISCFQTVFSQNKNKSKFSDLSGQYLGQKPPGITAELFAPGLLSSGGSTELNISFSPDGKEFCYSLIAGGEKSNLPEPRGPFLHRFLMYSHLINGSWTEPVEFPFIPNHLQWLPVFCPGGNRIFFNSKRNDVDPLYSSSPNIWYVERQNGEWCEPKEIDFGEKYNSWTGVKPSVAANGSLYFTLFPDRRNGSIFISRFVNGKYLFPEKLSETINSHSCCHPCIAPDESYLLFDSTRPVGSFGDSDIFISFRDTNGKWKKPQNLGKKVNTGYMEGRPFVSFDGKYMFFASNRINSKLPDEPVTLKELQHLTNKPEDGYQHIYWIDAKVIDELKPEHLK